jgi:gamma-glutamylputrescine oxidase
VILACNGYLGGLDPGGRAGSCRSTISSPPPNRWANGGRPVLTRDVAVSDTVRGQLLPAQPRRRLLFGGGETYGYRFPADIAALVRKPMTQIFPHLRDVCASTMPGAARWPSPCAACPIWRGWRPTMLSASGYSGHGVGNGDPCGR